MDIVNEKSSIFNKFLSISIGSWLAMVIGFLTTPITTRLLSPEQFGKVSLFLLVVDVLTSIILMGSDQSFVRFFYDEKEENRPVLLLHSLSIALAAFCFATIVFLLFYKPISTFIFAESGLWLIVLLLIYVFLRIFSTFSSLVVRMQQKGKLFSLIQVLNKTLEFVGILFFASILGDRYEVIIYSQIFFMVIVTMVGMGIEYPFWNFFQIRRVKLKNNMLERIQYGIPLTITLLMTLVFQSVDRIAIKEWSDYRELGLYYAAFKIIALLNMVQINFTAFWTPLSYEKYAKNPKDTLFFQKIYEVVAFSMLVIAAGLLMFKGSIVYLLGEEYSGSAVIIPFLVFIPMMYTISEVTVVGINFQKKTKLHMLIALTVCCLNVIGNFLLVPALGASGAAISTGFSYIVFFAMRTHFSLQYFKVDYQLAKFYGGVLLLVLYAFLTTFYDQSLYLSLIGILVEFSIFMLYKKTFIGLVGKAKRNFAFWKKR